MSVVTSFCGLQVQSVQIAALQQQRKAAEDAARTPDTPPQGTSAPSASSLMVSIRTRAYMTLQHAC